MKRLVPLLMALLPWLSGCWPPLNACEEQPGACLNIDIVGDVGPLEEVLVEIGGAAQVRQAGNVGRPTPPPLAFGAKLPDRTLGQLDVTVIGLRHAAPVSRGTASLQFRGGYATTTVLLGPWGGASCW